MQVFLDVEGNENGSFIYLLGVLIVDGDSHNMHSFWANSQEEEAQAFEAFLNLLDGNENFSLFHYGSYEKKFLNRMRKTARRQELVDRIIGKMVNVLSVIHATVYFPTFSNGLKEIAGYLGYTWTEKDASGLQSLVWRAQWEQCREPILKEKLLTYNAEDCAALRKVTESIQAIDEAARNRGEGATRSTVIATPKLAWADEIAVPSSRPEWCRPKFALQEFDYINRCAYFDYQREKVFLRTNGAIKGACRQRAKHKKQRQLAPNKEIEVSSEKCPNCDGNRITRINGETKSKIAYDLKFTDGGIRRQVIRFTAAYHLCDTCNLPFLPQKFSKLEKHLRGLKSWAVYQHVVHRISLKHLTEMIHDSFGLRVRFQEFHMLKALMASRYRATWKLILQRIVGGDLIHADETHANLKVGKGYVWGLTNMEDVIYLYKPNREAEFLRPLLGDFKGVLVSDFFTGYDSLPCHQQKCLVHLIRDFNDDLKNNPFDEEFKTLTAEFGKLLRSIISTIDRFGLKKWHLRKHKVEVACFFKAVKIRRYRSELAESYVKRLVKNEKKLFTFLEHDGVPWNNNNAEHAMKAFAYYRRLSDGMVKEQGLSDYLILLSVYQTCKYRGISFLKFLLSGERDIESFGRRVRKKNVSPVLEVYPKGFPREYDRKKKPRRKTEKKGDL